MEIRENTLDNGLTVVTVPQADTPTATVMVMVGTGSRHENNRQNGISHFLEHMFFKGTENRPSSELVSTELDSLGAESNAFTNYEYTAYYGKAQADKASNILEVLADIYQNSLLPEEEIEREAGVITEEIQMYNDLPMQMVHDVFQQHMFPNHPLGRKILGTKDNVNAFTRNDFLEYKEEYYRADNTTVVVAGGVSADNTLKKVKEFFAGIEDKDEMQQPEAAKPKPQSQITFQQKDSDQTHLVLGAPAVSRSSDKLPAMEVLSTILGRGMSSRLFKKLRNEMGVCYYVRSTVDYFTDTGLFKISTGVDTDRLPEVGQAITDSLRKIAEQGVENDELNKAQEFVAGNFLLNHETTDQIARDFAKQAILEDSIETPAEYTNKLHKVTTDQVQTMARSMLDSGLHAAVIGPQCDKKALTKSLN